MSHTPTHKLTSGSAWSQNLFFCHRAPTWQVIFAANFCRRHHLHPCEAEWWMVSGATFVWIPFFFLSGESVSGVLWNVCVCTEIKNVFSSFSFIRWRGELRGKNGAFPACYVEETWRWRPFCAAVSPIQRRWTAAVFANWISPSPPPFFLSNQARARPRRPRADPLGPGWLRVIRGGMADNLLTHRIASSPPPPPPPLFPQKSHLS